MYLTRTTVTVSLATPPLEEITRNATVSRDAVDDEHELLVTCIHVNKKEFMMAGRLRRNVVQIACRLLLFAISRRVGNHEHCTVEGLHSSTEGLSRESYP